MNAAAHDGNQMQKIFVGVALAGALAGGLAPRRGLAQTATVNVPLSIFGEVRTRGEWDQPGGALHANVYTYLRSRLGVRAEPARGVRIVAQLQDSRVFGAETNSTISNPDAFELHQGYVELATNWRSRDLVVRVGRQEVMFANERLVGAVDWSNTARAFDGVRVFLTPGGAKAGTERWTASAFVAAVEERGRKFGATTASGTAQDSLPNHNVAGLYASRALTGGMAELTALYDAGMHYRTFIQSNRATLDARIRKGAGKPIGFEVEGAWQTGSQRYQAAGAAVAEAQDVNAWLVGARLTRPAAPNRRVTAALGVDMLSGDANPSDGSYSAFNTMFATNHPFYGLMDLFLDPAARTVDRGLIDALVSTAITLPPRTTLRVELHHFAPQAGSRAEIGWEMDVTVPVRISTIALFETGYTAFRAGPAALAMGLGTNNSVRQWMYAQLKASF